MNILDTRHPFDAGTMGYDGPVDPREDGEGLIVTGERATLKNPPSVRMVGPAGEIELTGRQEIEAVIWALQLALGETI